MDSGYDYFFCPGNQGGKGERVDLGGKGVFNGSTFLEGVLLKGTPLFHLYSGELERGNSLHFLSNNKKMFFFFFLAYLFAVLSEFNIGI